VVESVLDFALICRVVQQYCALPLQHVIETLRPLPATPLAGAPDYVLGLSVIRGAPVPVVDAARLLGAGPAPSSHSPSRLVLLNTGTRRVALAVDAVVGVQALDSRSQQDLPPLLREAGDGAIESLGLLDAELMLVLQSAHLLPPQLPVAMDASP
jgi:purine-binding chemotaxis protein CheW